jgi:hypothetical protein
MGEGEEFRFVDLTGGFRRAVRADAIGNARTQASMSVRTRLAIVALALPPIGDEEADKLNNLLENFSQNQGLNRCVSWTAMAKRGSNET